MFGNGTKIMADYLDVKQLQYCTSPNHYTWNLRSRGPARHGWTRQVWHWECLPRALPWEMQLWLFPSIPRMLLLKVFQKALLFTPRNSGQGLAEVEVLNHICFVAVNKWWGTSWSTNVVSSSSPSLTHSVVIYSSDGVLHNGICSCALGIHPAD